jgi:hypothetical protein
LSSATDRVSKNLTSDDYLIAGQVRWYSEKKEWETKQKQVRRRSCEKEKQQVRRRRRWGNVG